MKNYLTQSLKTLTTLDFRYSWLKERQQKTLKTKLQQQKR